jgi:hypothetical protein
VPVKAATEKIADAIANFFMEFAPYEEELIYTCLVTISSLGEIQKSSTM